MICFAFGATDSNELVNIENVARSHGGAFHWYPVQRTFNIVLAKDTAKFTLDMPYALYKGKSINLSKAPELRQGEIWIASADADKIFGKVSPVAAPKHETAGTREVNTIVIDPGHGGKDPGAQGKNANEKDIVLAVGKLLKTELEKEGFKVKLTRSTDTFIELGERANMANKWDGDLFISLHCNAIDANEERKKQVMGYHFYVLRAPESEEDKAIARRENKVATLYGEKNAKEELTPLEWFKLQARLEKYKQNSYMFTEELLQKFDNGKIKKQANGVGGAGFMVLVGAMMPAVLVELGFISNPEDEAYMMTEKGQQDLATRVSNAVVSYKNAVHSYRETLGR